MHQLRLLAVTEPVAELWTEPEPPEPAAARPQRGTGSPVPLVAQGGQGAQTPGSPSQSLWGRLRGALPGGKAHKVPEAGASEGAQQGPARAPPVPRMVQNGHQAVPAASPAGTRAGPAQTPGSPSQSLWGRLRGALPGGTAYKAPEAGASEGAPQDPGLDQTTEGSIGPSKHHEQQLQGPGWWAKIWARAAGRRKARASRHSSTGAQQPGGELSGNLGMHVVWTGVMCCQSLLDLSVRRSKLGQQKWTGLA